MRQKKAVKMGIFALVFDLMYSGERKEKDRTWTAGSKSRGTRYFQPQLHQARDAPDPWSRFIGHFGTNNNNDIQRPRPIPHPSTTVSILRYRLLTQMI